VQSFQVVGSANQMNDLPRNVNFTKVLRRLYERCQFIYACNFSIVSYM
jgi:hypothetical protein